MSANPTYLNVQPAYGVFLNSQKAVREHYDALKDFQILTLGSGYRRYINKTDVERAAQRGESLTLEVRYGKDGAKVMLLPDA